MGEIADLMVEGFLCEGCGCDMGEDAPGYARRCPSCGGGNRATRGGRPSKAEYRGRNTARIRNAGLDFEVKNKGEHLVVQTERGVVDVWPSSGKWRTRGPGAQTKQGIASFLRFAAKHTFVISHGAHHEGTHPIATSDDRDEAIGHALALSPRVGSWELQETVSPDVWTWCADDDEIVEVRRVPVVGGRRG